MNSGGLNSRESQMGLCPFVCSEEIWRPSLSNPTPALATVLSPRAAEWLPAKTLQGVDSPHAQAVRMLSLYNPICFIFWIFPPVCFSTCSYILVGEMQSVKSVTLL